MGQACCGQNVNQPVQVIATGDAKPVSPDAEKAGEEEKSASSTPAAAAASGPLGSLPSAVEKGSTPQGAALVPLAATAPPKSHIAQPPSPGGTAPSSGMPECIAKDIIGAAQSLRRQSSLILANEKPPAPPPEASQDLNGSAVSALRQPNLKRSLRAGATAPAAMDVSSTTLRNATGSTAAPCALWASLPVVAKDSNSLGAAAQAPGRPAAATRSNSHSHKERYAHGGSCGNGNADPGSLLLPRESFNDGGDRETWQSMGHRPSGMGQTDRSQWDDSSLLEEANA